MTTDHVLADGTQVQIRPLLYSDREDLASGFRHLSDRSKRLRFLVPQDHLSLTDLEYLTNLDYERHFAMAAFVATAGGPVGVGVARYIREAADARVAEAAVTVLDRYQRRGVGTLLLVTLAEEARRRGVRRFTAHVLWENEVLLDALRRLGATVRADEPGIAVVEADLIGAGPGEQTPSDQLRAALRLLRPRHADRDNPVVGGDPERGQSSGAPSVATSRS
jgi:GNAT superfamily N-acetyltransferase